MVSVTPEGSGWVWGAGEGGVGFRMERRRTSVTSHCSKPDNTAAVYMPAPWTPGGPRVGGRGLFVVAPPPALLSPLPPGRPDPPPPSSTSDACRLTITVCAPHAPRPPPCRGERDRRDLLALAINPSCQRVNLSPPGLGVRLRLTITASDRRKCIFFMSLQLKERYLLTRLDGRECVGCSIKN